MSKPEKSTFRRSKVRPHCSCYCGIKKVAKISGSMPLLNKCVRFRGFLSLNFGGRLLLCKLRASPTTYAFRLFFSDRRLDGVGLRPNPRGPTTTRRPPNGGLAKIGVLTASFGRGPSFILKHESVVTNVLNWKVLHIVFTFHLKDVHALAPDWATGCLLGRK